MEQTFIEIKEKFV